MAIEYGKEAEQYLIQLGSIGLDSGPSKEEYKKIETAVGFVDEYSNENNTPIEEIDSGDVKNIRRRLFDIYDTPTAQSLLNRCMRFISFCKNEKEGYIFGDSGIRGDTDTEESEVVDTIESMIKGRDYQLEANIMSPDNRNFRIDILIDGKLAIECKGGNNTRSLITGIGQCMIYKYEEFIPYLITPVYWDNLEEVCNEAGICLIYINVEEKGLYCLSRNSVFDKLERELNPLPDEVK